jgi:hypothetical protein
VPGESYEFTLRTALNADRISSAAAIVEIAVPKGKHILIKLYIFFIPYLNFIFRTILEDELVEVGNLIVTSRFRPDGNGVVNLTWEIPANLQGKIRCNIFVFLLSFA